MAEQRRELESSIQEQRQQLQAQEEELAVWKADTQRQLGMQQVQAHSAAALSVPKDSLKAKA